MRLAGKVAVVTGGGSGIGRASAMLFAREGARVAIVDRDAAAGDTVTAEITAQGGTAIALPGDVGLAATSTAGTEAVLDAWGRIDVLMTAAGFSCGGTVLTTAPEDWDAVFATNVGGTWLWARAVIPAMQRQGSGSIITVASQLALAGGRGNAAYIAAKGAILSLTRTMAVDFAGDGIRVNAIAPGAIETPLLARSFARRPDPEAARAQSRSRHALQRFGTPGEIAAAALYLASDDAAFTTGTTLVVDGGWLAA
jgi:2-keto-3-deoxy-L-fuconate dehydrogenase